MQYLKIGTLGLFWLMLPILGTSQEKSRPMSKVVLSGKADSFISATSIRVQVRLGEDAEKKIADALKKVTALGVTLGDNKKIVFVVPADRIPPGDLIKVVKKQAVAAEGFLSSTEDELLLIATGSKETGRLPILVVEKMVWLDDSNRAGFPELGSMTIEGIVQARKLKVGNEDFGHGVVNGDQEIPVHVGPDLSASFPEGQVRLGGKVRINGGRLVVDVNRSESTKK